MQSAKRIILMLSGGVESTFTLQNLLETTDSIVHPYYVKRNFVSGKNEANVEIELIAVERVLNHYRVAYSDRIEELVVGETIFPWDMHGRWMDMVTIAGAWAALSLSMRYAPDTVGVATGINKEEWDSMQSTIQVGRGLYTTLIQRKVEAMPGINPLNELVSPGITYTKAEMVEKIPFLYWTCEDPVENRPCGKCAKCNEFRTALTSAE